MKMMMRGLMAGAFGLLIGAGAPAEEAGEPYAKVGPWEITAEPGLKRCSMQRFYVSRVDKRVEGLIVVYDADKDGVLLLWSNDTMTYLPAEGHLDLDVRFHDGASAEQSLGNGDFHYKKVANDYYFTRPFLGSGEAARILGEFARNASVSFFLGPVSMTALPLDASGAVEKLRSCSSGVGRTL